MFFALLKFRFKKVDFRSNFPCNDFYEFRTRNLIKDKLYDQLSDIDSMSSSCMNFERLNLLSRRVASAKEEILGGTLGSSTEH